MDIDAKPLRCFVAVAEERSFSRAAQRMHVTQPTLSAQIKGLEQLLGFELFQRTTRQVSLSPQGRAFLKSAERMVEESDRLKRMAETLRRSGEKRLSIGAAFYTIDIEERVRLLEGFIGAHPDVAVDIDTRWQYELMADLQRGVLDFALVIGAPVDPATMSELMKRPQSFEILYPSNLRTLVLRREPIRILMPNEMENEDRETVPLSALNGKKVAVPSPAHGELITKKITDLLKEAGAEPIVPPEPHGIGVERYGRQFRIPAITIGWFGNRTEREGQMTRRALEGLNLETSLALLSNPDVSSPQLEAFWEFAKGMAGE